MSANRYTTDETYREIRVTGNDPLELMAALRDFVAAFEHWHGDDTDGVHFTWEIDGASVLLRFGAGTKSVSGW